VRAVLKNRESLRARNAVDGKAYYAADAADDAYLAGTDTSAARDALHAASAARFAANNSCMEKRWQLVQTLELL